MGAFMTGLNNAISQSLLTRFLANVVATVTIVTAVIVLAIEALHGEPLNPWFIGVAGLGLGQYANITGVNQGVTLQPLAAPAPKKATTTSGTLDISAQATVPMQTTTTVAQ